MPNLPVEDIYTASKSDLFMAFGKKAVSMAIHEYPDNPDMIPEALEGLWKAILRYDSSKGPLSGWLKWYVKQTMGRSRSRQKSLIRIPPEQLPALARILAAKEKLTKANNGKTPTVEEISKESGENEATVTKLLAAPRSVGIPEDIGFDAPSENDDYKDFENREAIEEILKKCPPELQEEARTWLEASKSSVGVKKIGNKIRKFLAEQERGITPKS